MASGGYPSLRPPEAHQVDARRSSAWELAANIAASVFRGLLVVELTKVSCVSSHWRSDAGQSDLWRALAPLHFGAGVCCQVSDRESFVMAVKNFQSLLQLEQKEQPHHFMKRLFEISCSPQPCPPSDRDGVMLLLGSSTPSHLIPLLRMDDETEWVSRLSEEVQRTFYMYAMLTLELLCRRCPQTRVWARQVAFESNGFMDFLGVLQQYLLQHMHGLHQLNPGFVRGPEGEPILCRFNSQDCRQLSWSGDAEWNLKMLKATCDMYFHLFGVELEDASQEVGSLARLLRELQQPGLSGPVYAMRLAVVAVELSGEWRTAICLDDRRHTDVPGNFRLQFQESGVVSGFGRDRYGAFDLTGFWTPWMWLLRKSSEGRGYVVDLLGFFDEDGSVHGAWLFSTRAAGFWACKGPPRDTLPAVALTR